MEGTPQRPSPPAEATGDGDPMPLSRRRVLSWAAGGAAILALGGCRSESSADTAPATSGTPSTSPTGPAGSTTTATNPNTTGSTSTTSTTSSSTTTSNTAATNTSTTAAPEQTTEPTDGSADPGSESDVLYVALYGHPGNSTLGVLGEQDIPATVDRAREVANTYEGFGRRVVPTFEIIATVASAEAGSDGDYSNEFGDDTYIPWIEAAADNGYHVVFDLQSGRARFPDQAREHAGLWTYPNVSIALDPEWRVGPNEKPGGGKIGTVDAAEVNETIAYIDQVVRDNDLPPKLLVVHQFVPSMVTNKPQIAGTATVQVLMQMDGFGSLNLKQGSWAAMVADLPPGSLTGWKNFYDEDQPTPTPAETLANDPSPTFVSYQ